MYLTLSVCLFVCLYSWLREQHALPRAINLLFSPSLQNRLNMFVSNPMFSLQEECAGNQTPLNQTSHQPFLTSTPFPKSALTSSTFMADKFYSEMGLESVDLFVKNPLFGSGLGFQSKVIFHHSHCLVFASSQEN